MGWTGICGVWSRRQARGWASMRLKTVNHFFKYFNGAEATPQNLITIKVSYYTLLILT